MNLEFLQKTLLFQGIAPQEIGHMLACLQARERHFKKGEVICRAGEPVTALGMVLTGSVSIDRDDFWGTRSALAHLGPGQIFAEAYACVPAEALMVQVTAQKDSDILFLEVPRLLAICDSACGSHSRLIRNLLTISSQKNLELSRKIAHTAAKSIRGRLLSYLSYQALRGQSREFTIPLDRQQLADYLNVDRSALSNELSKMQRDGLIRVHRSRFLLLDTTDYG